MADLQTADHALLREMNVQIVLAFIRDHGPLSRAEIARRVRLSRSTVSSIIASLLAAGYVSETGIGDSQGGRRPIMVDFNYQACYVVGVDMANASLTVLLTDLQAQVVRRVVVACDLNQGPTASLEQLSHQFHALLRETQIDPASIGGVGVGVPGPLSSGTGRPIAPPVMPGWHDVPLHQMLETALSQRVFLENDANLGALAEQTWGAARGLANVAFVYVGSAGVGGGLILDGQLYRGDVGSAGEIGHLTIDEDGPPCRCGSNGCLEAYVGAPALLERAHSRNLETERVEDLVALASEGNPTAAAIIAEAGTHLGVAIASLLNLLNPRGIVVGGALALAGDLLLEPLRATLQRRGLAVAAKEVALRSGLLGQDVIALGAASLAIQQVLRDPVAALSSRPGPQALGQLSAVRTAS